MALASAVWAISNAMTGNARGCVKTREMRRSARCVSRMTVEMPVDRLTRAVCARRSGPDRCHQRSHPEDRDHSLQVVSQDVEAHLGSDLVEGPGQEVGGAHPGLEGPERVFDGLSSHAHGLGHAVEPSLHPVEYVLVLPALDAPQLGRRAAGSERTGGAGAQVVVEVEVFRVIRGSSI